MAEAAAVADPVDAPVADPAPIETPVVPVVVEGQVGDPAGVADTDAPKTPSLADFSDDDLLAHLRERKNGDGLSLEERLRKSERDKYETEQRKKLGTAENVQRRTARFLQKHGIDPADVDANDLGGLNVLSHLAHQDALGNIGEAWIKATADEFSIADRVLIDEALSKFKDDPTGIDDLASRMLLSVRDATRTRTLSEVSLSDVPEGSKLRGDINAEVQRLADAEIKARDLAAKRSDSPPAAPNGAPSATDDERFARMTTGEVSYLPEPERAKWRAWRAKQP